MDQIKARASTSALTNKDVILVSKPGIPTMTTGLCIFRPEPFIVTVFEPNNNILTIPWLYPYIAFVPFISVAKFTILIGSLQTSEVKSVGYSVTYC